MAGKPKGLPKSGGRVKGSQNVDKRSVREIVESVLGMSLPEKIMGLCNDLERTNKPVALKAYNDLMKYSYPTFASVQVEANVVTEDAGTKRVSELASLLGNLIGDQERSA